MEPLLREFGASGQVRIESHPVAFLHDDSLRAAHAALCAQEQHKARARRCATATAQLPWAGRGRRLRHRPRQSTPDVSPVQYWEMRHLLFQAPMAGSDEGGSVFTGRLLRRLAEEAGLDIESFVQCFTVSRDRGSELQERDRAGLAVSDSRHSLVTPRVPVTRRRWSRCRSWRAPWACRPPPPSSSAPRTTCSRAWWPMRTCGPSCTCDCPHTSWCLDCVQFDLL